MRSSRLWEFIKRPLIAVAVPIKMSIWLGHLRSSFIRRAVDRTGQPVPWYTYPAIHFLSTLNFSNLSVLEFGSGQSSVWWGHRARSVVCLETDSSWFEHVQNMASDLETVECVFCNSEADQAEWPLGKTFDIVVIDGGDRFQCARTAVDVVSDRGWILVDDSEGSWGAEDTYPIIDLLSERGFARVDFYGFAPGTYALRCTSIFFKSQELLMLNQPPVRERALVRTNK